MSAIKRATRHWMLIFLLYFRIFFGMFFSFWKKQQKLAYEQPKSWAENVKWFCLYARHLTYCTSLLLNYPLWICNLVLAKSPFHGIFFLPFAFPFHNWLFQILSFLPNLRHQDWTVWSVCPKARTLFSLHFILPW